MADQGIEGGPTKIVTVAARFLNTETGVESNCLLVHVEGDAIEVRSTQVPDLATAIVCYSDTIGRVVGVVEGRTAGGFSLRPTGSNPSLTRVRRRLQWLHDNGTGESDLRKDLRFVPTVVATEIRLASAGEGFEGSIVDLSRSGVSIESVLRPNLGTRLYVGKRGADVVRSTEKGFAARFVVPLPATDAGVDIRL